MSNETTIPTQQALKTYHANQIEGATPGRLVLMLYDYVLACLRRGDGMRAKKGLVELMGSLNLDYLDVAGPLFRLYEYCLDIVREKEFEEAQGYIEELREAWLGVVERTETGTARNLENVEA